MREDKIPEKNGLRPASDLESSPPLQRIVTTVCRLHATPSNVMSNDENNLGNVIAGTFFGALAGGGLGLGACMLLFDNPPFFTGDTILIGAIACGSLGFFLGAGFIEWLKENCWEFWW